MSAATGKSDRHIAIAADHGGYEQKEVLAQWLAEKGYTVDDFGCFESEVSVDYPDYAGLVAHAVSAGQAEAGVLVCGTGLGMSYCANKVAGIRAAVLNNTEYARLARAHNDANIACLSGRFVDEKSNKRILDTFLNTDFEGGRHAVRVAKIHELERGDE